MNIIQPKSHTVAAAKWAAVERIKNTYCTLTSFKYHESKKGDMNIPMFNTMGADPHKMTMKKESRNQISRLSHIQSSKGNLVCSIMCGRGLFKCV